MDVWKSESAFGLLPSKIQLGLRFMLDLMKMGLLDITEWMVSVLYDLTLKYTARGPTCVRLSGVITCMTVVPMREVGSNDW